MSRRRPAIVVTLLVVALLAGAATLGVVALMQGSPYLAYVPTWLLLGCAGAVLLALGVAWESALGAGRQVGRWVHALR